MHVVVADPTPPPPPPAHPPAKTRKKPHRTSKRSTALPPADAAAPAVQEERKPIRTPADLAAAIRAAADANVNAAAALSLSAPTDVPLPTHSLALLLRRLATTPAPCSPRGASSTSSTPPARTGRSRTLCATVAGCARSPASSRCSGTTASLPNAHLYNALMKAHVAADDPGAVLRVILNE
ncbi:hypothetical protein BDA96_04G018700 [Sorghum bicolor]|uniref:Uncharacterized protein n=2 Tax=Sorghum bicolor TaxID=4558 RepID=C5XSF1_SORBI|nr:hypothetical protein SORBI_3004G016200 [Sorghum bicolor]KAG0531383.1 hypothetical protein BDA96_04G018700 [Sorghum bicolor]